MQSIWFFTSVTKIFLDNFLKQFSKLYQLWGPSTWPLLEGWYTRSPWFSGGLEHITMSFWYFFVKSSLIARSCYVFVINIKSLIMAALVTLETRFRVPILAVFWGFLAFFKLFVLAQAFSLGHWFFKEKLVQCKHFYM